MQVWQCLGLCAVLAGLQEFVQGADRGAEEGEFLDKELDELPGPSYPGAAPARVRQPRNLLTCRCFYCPCRVADR